MIEYLHSQHVVEIDALFRYLSQFVSLKLENYLWKRFNKKHWVQAHLLNISLDSTHSDVIEKSIESLKLKLLIHV